MTKFYHALQMDPTALKKQISACGTKREKFFYWTAMAVRAVLIVLFAVGFISGLSGLFGQENAPLAVALFCILLGLRFVNFEYCIGDSMVTLAIALGILVFAPSAAAAASPLATAGIHFLSIFLLLCITAQRPELGNGGLFSFAYVYLAGNPVYGASLQDRAMMALVGYLICGAILYAKHRHTNTSVRFHTILFRWDLKDPISLWQLRIALGVSLLLTAGNHFGIERFMWMVFACSSLLLEYPYSADVAPRFWQRIIGVLLGSAAFFLFYQVMPHSLHPLMGPLGGLCLGFCTDYRYKTALNCFGALMVATGIYGLQGAILLRIADTLLGVLFAMAFAILFHKCIASRFLRKEIS